MELFKAHRQWASRPADERFTSLQDLYNQTKHYAEQAKTTNVNYADLRVEAVNGEVQLVGRTKVPAQLTHWSFGQLAAKIDAPASYLRDLPATLAVQNLNHGLSQRATNKDTASLMFHSNGSLLLRAITSEHYARIWNYEVAERLLDLETKGWTPARPTFRSSVENEPPSLYASDHDMFAFICSDSRIPEPGNDRGLLRGVIVENSEVGASALKLTRFLYREMCGNHIIWGASKVLEISVRHVGNAREKWGFYQGELKRYAESSVNDEAAKIASSRTVRIGDTKEQVLDRLFGMRSLGLSRKMLDRGFEAVKQNEDGDARTVWGMTQGLTRASQTLEHADQRIVIDKAAGKLLEFVF